MTALIPVTDRTINESLIPTVNARELHQFLENKSRFNDWVNNRISSFGFVLGRDFATLTENLVSGGNRTEYFLSLDMAKELSMVERTEKGKEARLYFIECEKRLFRPQSHLETAKQLVASLEHAERLQIQLTEQAPKVEAFEDLMSVEGSISMLAASKLLGIGRTTLFKRLKQMGILMKNRLPYQEYAHHFEVRAGSWQDPDGEGHACETTRVTLPGLDYLRKRLKCQ